MNIEQLIDTARIHYENLVADIANASTRIEHIRISTLAQEAHKLLTDIQAFEIGLVYTRTTGLSEEDMHKYQALRASSSAVASTSASTFDEPLDLPEFKSPFTPPAG